MQKYNDVIGLLGGMGSYSTLYFFRRILDSFPSEEEYERPRIIIDNYCTLPNKIKAYLFGTDKELLIQKMETSLSKLVEMGCNENIIICYSAHAFLDEIFQIEPTLKSKFIDILDCLVNKLRDNGVSKALVLTTENTAKIGVFDKYFSKYGVELSYNYQNYSKHIDVLMRAGEKNIIDEYVKQTYAELINTCYEDCPIILGCTELSIINYYCGSELLKNMIYDPLDCALELLLTKIS